MADRKRKRMVQQQPDRRANRTILVRTLFLLTLFGVAAFVPLLVRLWQIQIRDYDKYQGMAVEQQTADSTVEANRGTIYDRSGETLAMSATVYNIQLSPKEILACQEAYREKAANAAENGKTLDYPEPPNEFIASNLAQLLDLDEADILNRLTKTSSMYEIIKWRVEDDERKDVFQCQGRVSGRGRSARRARPDRDGCRRRQRDRASQGHAACAWKSQLCGSVCGH